MNRELIKSLTDRINEIRKQMALRFQVLPKAMEDRAERLFRDITDGKISAFRGAELYLTYFFQRVELMCDRPTLTAIQDAGEGHILGFVVPKVCEVTLHIDRIPKISITEGVNVVDPALMYRDFQVIADNLLSRTTLVEDILRGNIQIRNLADALKWFAPIAAVETAEKVRAVREADLALLEGLLRDLGY